MDTPNQALYDKIMVAVRKDALVSLNHAANGSEYTADDSTQLHLTDLEQKQRCVLKEQLANSGYKARIADLRNNKIKTVQQKVAGGFKQCGCDLEPCSFDHFKTRLEANIRHFTDFMDQQRELLDETKRLCNAEKERLENFDQQNMDSSISASTVVTPESEILKSAESWMNSRLGNHCLNDNSHIVFDTSTSSILRDVNLQSPQLGVRIKCDYRKPRDTGSVFKVEHLRPLRGSLEAIKIANAQSSFATPSVLVTNVIWSQVSENASD